MLHTCSCLMKAVNPIIIIKKECSVSNINSDQYILLMTFLILLMWEDHSDQNSFLHPWHIAMNKWMSRREMAKHLSSTQVRTCKSGGDQSCPTYSHLILISVFHASFCANRRQRAGVKMVQRTCYLLASLQEEQQVKECLHLALPTEFVDQLKERNMKTKQRGECVRQKKKGGKERGSEKEKKMNAHGWYQWEWGGLEVHPSGDKAEGPCSPALNLANTNSCGANTINSRMS